MQRKSQSHLRIDITNSLQRERQVGHALLISVTGLISLLDFIVVYASPFLLKVEGMEKYFRAGYRNVCLVGKDCVHHQPARRGIWVRIHTGRI